MAKVNEKLKVMQEALGTLKESIPLFKEYKKKYENEPNKVNEQLMEATRDSMIQRFEYCTDLLWKLFKIYLEEVEKIALTSTSPRGIIRESVSIRAIPEKEGNEAMEMITRRNETSHIYHEEIAEAIASEVPFFYELMSNMVKMVQNKIET